MSRHIALAPHLEVADLEQRYRTAHEPHERSWWQILWLLAKGKTATAIAESTGYTRYWIGQIAKRYNAQGPDGMHNRQHTTSWRAPRMLTVEQHEELRQALAGTRCRRLDGNQAEPASGHATGLGLPAAPQAQPATAPAAPYLGRS